MHTSSWGRWWQKQGELNWPQHASLLFLALNLCTPTLADAEPEGPSDRLPTRAAPRTVTIRGKRNLTQQADETTVRLLRDVVVADGALSDASIIYLDNRPEVGVLEATVLEHLGHLKDWALEQPESPLRKKPYGWKVSKDGVDLRKLPTRDEEIRRILELPQTGANLIDLIEGGLPSGAFSDTAKVARWIHQENTQRAFSRRGMRPLELVIAHAETEIDELLQMVRDQQIRPAAIIASGSPLMLSDVYQRRSVQQSLELIGTGLEQEIPLLGICFGLHQIAYRRFGVLPHYMEVPDGVSFELHRSVDKFVPVRPGQRRMVFGARGVARQRKSALLKGIKNLVGLMVHSQALSADDPSLPAEAVLATSNRRFTDSNEAVPTNDDDLIKMRLVQILQAGPLAFGTQMHPEVTPALLTVLTHVAAFNEELRREGQVLEVIREELARHPIKRRSQRARRGPYAYAGEVVGRRFITLAAANRIAIADRGASRKSH